MTPSSLEQAGQMAARAVQRAGKRPSGFGAELIRIAQSVGSGQSSNNRPHSPAGTRLANSK